MKTNRTCLFGIFIFAVLLMTSGISSAAMEPRVSVSDGKIAKSSASAPGYCESYGGSTYYEYITSVSYTKNPSGTMTITVNVYITNSCGCTYGEPCACYDNSPEYVHVWVDWNGDKVFEDDEKVIDDALTGYTNINYRGAMTSSHVVTVPSNAVNYTWMRANLGWSSYGDPCDDPCGYSWTYGNVVDKEIGTLTPPRIESIKVEGKDAGYKNNPVANKEVVLTATITEASGYEVYEISWWGDVKEVEGPISNYNPYTYKPAPTDYGLKFVGCTIFYKNTNTGEINADVESKLFKLFFIKNGDDNTDAIPNWFEYWQRDNACPHLSECEYDKDKTGFGAYNSSKDKVILGPLAARDNTVVTIPVLGACGGGLGIDSCYQTIVHELKHKWVNDNWKDGGAWKGKNDTDKDKLPDDWEDSYTYNAHKFGKNNSDTYGVHTMYPHWGGYKSYGDNEALCRLEENEKTIIAENDWACPGKQTNPPYDGKKEVMTAKTILISGIGISSSSTGISNVTEQGIDSDDDGKYNNLRITISLTSNETMSTQIIAKLLDSNQSIICSERIYPDVVIGNQQAQLDFDATEIRNSGKNGPYTLNVSFYRIEHDAFLLDSKKIITANYSYTNFQPQDAIFSGVYTDYGIDTDSDGVYEQLNVNVGLTVIKNGTYNMEGWLYDTDGSDMVLANKSSSLTVGSRNLTLGFDGTSIGNHRKNGPYTLKYLKLTDGNDKQVDFVGDAYNTSAYTYSQFKKYTGGAKFRNSYNDYGSDINLDGMYDYIVIEVGLNVTNTGNYTLTGILYDKNGNNISMANTGSSLNTGNQTMLLNFNGDDVYNNMVDGPYILKYLVLQNNNGTQADYLENAYNTTAYNYTDFASKPLVSLTGNYSDNGLDINNDSLYDYLIIGVGVQVASDGNVIITSRLMTSNDNEIQWASNTSYLYENKTNTMLLRFNGTLIHDSLINGPYQLKDLYLYHTGDPEKSIYVANVYNTTAYSYTSFKGSGITTTTTTLTTTSTTTTTTLPGYKKGDENCDGTVSDFELLAYINDWANGLVEDFDLLEAINNWAKG